MTFAPDVQAYLEAFEALGPPDISKLTVEEVRGIEEGFFVPRPIRQHPDIDISNETIAVDGNDSLTLRIYRPKKLKSEAPCFIYLRGGGFVLGTLDHYDPWCVDLAKGTQCTIISVDYRLAPEHPFPAGFNDSYHATQWIHAHAKDLNLGPGKIFLSGDSAGACLTLATALKMRDTGEPCMRGAVAIYPVVSEKLDTPSHDRYAGAYGGAIFSRAAMRWFFKHYIQDTKYLEDPYAIPLHATNYSNMPPTLIVTAEGDPLKDEGNIFAQRLRDADSPCETHDYAGMMHGFTLFEGMPHAEAARADLINRMGKFAQAHG